MTNYTKFHADRLYFFRLNLTHYRHTRSLTQEQLAEIADISPGYLAHLEAPHSDAEPSFETLCKLAFALDIEVSDLTAVDADFIGG